MSRPLINILDDMGKVSFDIAKCEARLEKLKEFQYATRKEFEVTLEKVGALEKHRIAAFTKQGHSKECAERLSMGDGVCECGLILIPAEAV